MNEQPRVETRRPNGIEVMCVEWGKENAARAAAAKERREVLDIAHEQGMSTHPLRSEVDAHVVRLEAMIHRQRKRIDALYAFCTVLGVGIAWLSYHVGNLVRDVPI